MAIQVSPVGALPEDASKYFNGTGAWTTPAGGDPSAAWPVGSIFLSAVATNPATLLGFGTWVAIAAGRVLVGLDTQQSEFDALGKTGGAKSVTLTEAQIPAHTHVQNAFAPRIINSGTAGSVGVQGASGASNLNASNSATTATNQNTGGGQAHSNLQPYLVIAMWQRTA